jgi:hypothetical protein
MDIATAIRTHRNAVFEVLSEFVGELTDTGKRSIMIL